MASEDPSADDSNLGLWSFDLMDADFNLLSPNEPVGNSSPGQLQPHTQEPSEDGWWLATQNDSNAAAPRLQQPALFHDSGATLNEFAPMLSPAADDLTYPISDVFPPSLGPSIDSLPPSSGLTAGQGSPGTLFVSSRAGSPPTATTLILMKPQKKRLQAQTGLTKTQVSNWLANARRRSKNSVSRTASPQQIDQTRPITIPPRPPTPVVRNDAALLNPLERWVESPPEHEPASATAIARAVASNSSFVEDSTSQHSLDGYGYPYETPSVGSVDTSLSSGGSFSSANSYGSQRSNNAFEPLRHARSRRRKRAFKRNGLKTPLSTAGKTFQCTFCTETFGRKYDWQRHENSLHLPLERWICAPNGPRSPDPTNNNLESCVFCGLVNPSDEHVNDHQYSACQERSVEQRTFNRKDHLRQHLRLFHDVSYSDWCMRHWRVPTPDIRSRCGFCNLSMTTWEKRADHLANHFKLGKTMADWEGDWGFERSILQIVENAIPPYIIETERHTPFPFQGSRAPAETPRSAYELIKLELAYYMQKYFDNYAKLPTIESMQFESCRIILASETGIHREGQGPVSWLRDVIVSDQELLQKARLGPIRSPMESRLASMKINGKKDLFEQCDFEAQLRDFVRAQDTQDRITDHELQEEACRIVVRVEKVSLTPSDFIATWLIRLINSSADWLLGFRQRMNIPRNEDVESSKGTKPPSTIHDYLRSSLSGTTQAENATEIDAELADVPGQDQDHSSPSGTTSMPRTQTEADFWLSAFNSFSAPMKHAPVQTAMALHPSLTPEEAKDSDVGTSDVMHGIDDQQSLLGARAIMMKTNGFFLGGPNFYRWIGEELHRWVVATMSPHNPAQHVPTDEEIQHYARWIAYNDGDPLNQTIADNPYWLVRFKRDAGIPEGNVRNEEPGSGDGDCGEDFSMINTYVHGLARAPT
ncbi:hypothetical protein NM208_g6228 [Fusarium decemcellulare]|uniref:Uncharacterized protein n=1 Tax=Fusarium decemcellulare TaxID=57161 RepID=A0ACC1SDU1_9HYPO|nr:hypothetical protein NM208_g6228 [Fusarium decemcellulare]